MTEEETNDNIDRALSSISASSILDGFSKYRQIWMRVLRERGRFVSTEMDSNPSAITCNSAISVFLYGVALSFLLYLPLITKHGLALDKFFFLLQFIYLQCLLVILVYLSSKIFRGQGTLKLTASVYMIFVGVISPLILILAYPLFFYIPAEVFLYIGSQNPYEILHVPQWVMIWSLAVLLLMLPVAFIVLLRWIADVNEIGRGRLILSMIVVYLPIMFVHDVYVAPYVSKGLRIFGEILGQLV